MKSETTKLYDQLLSEGKDWKYIAKVMKSRAHNLEGQLVNWGDVYSEDEEVEMLPRLPHDKSGNVSRKATPAEVRKMAYEDFEDFKKAFCGEES